MKIKDFSDEKGLTKQAVYKAIQRAGFSTKQLTDRHGNITVKGTAILRNLFPDVTVAEPAKETETIPQTPEKPIPDLQPEVDRLSRKVEELEKRCSEWEKRYFEAVEHARTETEQMRVLLSQEQQLRLAAENRHVLRRLFSGKKAAQ